MSYRQSAWQSARQSAWRARSCHGALIMALVLAGCSLPRTAGDGDYGEGFTGGVIADEPRAALVGRDVLAAGGSAGDAAVAAYFAMAVTMPGAASLGGGGVCLAYDPALRQVDGLNFLSVATIEPGTLAIGVPGSIRGMFALHARYGRLPWSTLLQPAETLARQGHTVSRAFARELQKAAPLINADAAARALFGDGPDDTVGEGQQIRQIELGAVLSVLRQRGPGAFYEGALGRQFVGAANALGSAVTVEDLRRYRPRLVAPIQVPHGNSVLNFAPPPATGGVTAAQMWTMLKRRNFDGTSGGARAHLVAEVSLRAYAYRAVWLVDGVANRPPQELVDPDRLDTLMASYDSSRHVTGAAPAPAPAPAATAAPAGAAGLVAVDRNGQAVACGFTLNQPFGAGRVAPGTGIVLATAPASPLTSPIAAVIAVNPNIGTLSLAAVAVGGAPAASALTGMLLATLDDGQPLAAALAAPRLHHGGLPDRVLYEPGVEDTAIDGLQTRGHETWAAPGLGQVSALHCPGGLPRDTACQFATDRRGFGLAARSDQ